MWETLGNALKVFFDKHFIPTVLSLVCGTIIFLCTSDDNWMLQKLSKFWYFLFISGCVFICIQIIIWLHSKISSLIYRLNEEKSNSQFHKIQTEEMMQQLWDYVGSLCPEEREYLKKFLKNKNKPITIRGRVFLDWNSLWNSDYVRKQNGFNESGSYTQYVLEENFYNTLCYSAEVYGKISRFDEV